MNLLQAILMGIIQGCTEFLPVSSSGHLVLLKEFLQIDKDAGLLFEVMLHLGTLTAVLLVFWRDIKQMFREGLRMLCDLLFNGRLYLKNLKDKEERRYRRVVHNNYRKFLLLLIVSLLPTVFLGILLEAFAEQAVQSLLATGIGFYITSVILLVADFSKEGSRLPKEVGYGCALVVGICQGLAVFPGISRSGITIAACLLCGFYRKFSIKYSFIMAVPTIVGAAVWELRKLPGLSLSLTTVLCGSAGVVAAAMAGFFCIKLMLRLIRKSRFRVFALYCFLIGTAAIVWNYIG